MKARDKNPTVRLDEEPEDERPLGTGEEVKPDSDGLALDPYADDTLFELARARVPRWLWVTIIILMLIVVALAWVIVIRARG